MPRSKKCLMLETPKKKKFFTHKENLKLIMDFAQNLNCSISMVKLASGPILDIEPLAKAISHEDYAEKPEFEIIEVIKEKRKSNKRK